MLGHANPNLMMAIIASATLLAGVAVYLLIRAGRATKLAQAIAERDRFWELAPDLMCVADFKGVIRRVNPAFVAVLGYKSHELIGQPLLSLVHVDDQDAVRRDLGAAEAGDRVFESVHRFRRKDGMYRWLTWNSQPAVAEGLFYAVGHDVTDRMVTDERQKAQDATLERLSRLQQAILDSSDYTIVTTDAEGTITTFNNAASRMFGYAAAEVIGKSSPAIFHLPHELEAEAKRIGAQLGRRVPSGVGLFLAAAEWREPYEHEWTFVRKGGAKFPAFLSVTALRNGVGQVTGLVGIARDITERKRREAELQQSLERFRTVTTLAPVGIYLTDRQGRAVFVNEHWSRLAGMSAPESLGAGWINAVHDDDRGRVFGQWQRAVAAGEEFSAEHRFTHTGGKVLDVTSVATPLRDAAGAITGYLGTVWDVTAEKQARHRLEDAVQQRTGELTTTNRRLEREVADRREAERRATELRDQLTHVARLSTMGELAAGLAHELNQPLGAIANYTKACVRMMESDGATREELGDVLTKVADQAHRAGQIIQRLRAFVARSEPQTQPVGVRDMVAEVVTLLEYDVKRGDVAVRQHVPDDVPPVEADRIQVQQVLLNLMRNAIEAMVAAGSGQRWLTVTARSCDDEGVVELSVSDSGPGCSDEQFGQLFEAFYTTKTTGMGLGLSISRSIIESHGGRLWASRDSGGGMSFRFTLPMSEESPDGQGAQVAQARAT